MSEPLTLEEENYELNRSNGLLLKHIATLTRERDTLRAALVGLVGASESQDLDAMEYFIRSTPVPAADRAVTLDAIHALKGDPS